LRRRYTVISKPDVENPYRGVATLISKDLNYTLHIKDRNLHLVQVFVPTGDVFILNVYISPTIDRKSLSL
jgi:hypothetical protein